MKILTVSDQVEPQLYEPFKPERFTGIDLILSCGDLPPEYLSFLVTMLNVPLFYVKGNHDIRSGGYIPVGCTDLDGKVVRFKGLRIAGFEGSNWYNGKPYQYTESQMHRKILRNRLKIWRQKVLILSSPTHHPAIFTTLKIHATGVLSTSGSSVNKFPGSSSMVSVLSSANSGGSEFSFVPLMASR